MTIPLQTPNHDAWSDVAPHGEVAYALSGIRASRDKVRVQAGSDQNVPSETICILFVFVGSLARDVFRVDQIVDEVGPFSREKVPYLVKQTEPELVVRPISHAQLDKRPFW
jgi:hypothetical protein